MDALLLITEEEEVEPALKLAERLLDSTAGAPDSEREELLGVWRRDELDWSLPSLLDAPALGLASSTSLNGRWSVAWISGTELEGVEDSSARRAAILARLVAPDSLGKPGTRVFRPVLAAAEQKADPTRIVGDLTVRFPGLIGEPLIGGPAELASQPESDQ